MKRTLMTAAIAATLGTTSIGAQAALVDEVSLSWSEIMRYFLVTLIMVLPLSSPAAPNIVLIMADDLSTDVFETLLQNGRLPHIQQHILNEGVTFQNSFVTNSECCPSRATALTGQYSHNHGVLSNHSPDPSKGGINWPGWLPQNGNPGHNSNTIATALEASGYRTGFIGKYLNGYGTVAPEGVADPRTYIPPGWTEWNGLLTPTVYRVYDYMINQNGVVTQYGAQPEDYQTDVLSGLAVDFVQRATLDSPVKPFFLMVTPLAPHIEVLDAVELFSSIDPQIAFNLTIRPAPRHLHLVDGNPLNDELAGLLQKPSFDESDLSDKPTCEKTEEPVAGIMIETEPACVAEASSIGTSEKLTALESQFKSMSASMLAVDDMVGEIVAELVATDTLTNTVIILTSDNGWFYGEHRLLGKQLAYEESIRVPLSITGPGIVRGGISDKIVLNTDLAPTIVDIAGATFSHVADGTSLVPLLGNPQNSNWHRTMFLVERWFIPSIGKYSSPTYFALRRISGQQDFLYVSSHTDMANLSVADQHEFYDLINDPYQVSSLALPDAMIQAFDNFLYYFRICRGLQCQILESL